jgi:hypothetical protein
MSEHSPKDDDLIHPLARPFLWLEAKWLKSSILYIVGLGAIALTVGEYFWERYQAAHHPGAHHEVVEIEGWLGFYAWWGFGSFVLAVMGGWFVIRHFLGREEDYWDKDAGDD